MRIFAAMLLTALVAFGQHHEMKPPVENPVVLYKGLGAWRHAISTKSPEAQKFFDQGLSLLYGFNRYEALRSFQKASQLDPAAGMPYWGIAASQGPYINMDGDTSVNFKNACEAWQAGIKAAIAAPERERDYLQAIASWCPEFRPQDYIRATKALAEKWPDDLDAQTLYAEALMIPSRWKWYGPDGRAADGMPEAERVLEAVLRRWPEHPGANHYYIHAVESSPNPERAIPSAQRLMGIVPAAGHMVHMPAHIWLVMGEYELAAELNERASAVDREYSAATNVKLGSYTGYYLHNMHFALYARAMQGHRAQALQAAAAISSEIDSMVDAMPELSDAFLTQVIFARVRVQAWDEVLKMPAPSEKLPLARTMQRYGRTLAQLAKGNRAEAAKERALFEQLASKIPLDSPYGQNKLGDALKIAREALAARMGEDSLAHWRKAVELQDGLVYDEPPAWYYPIRESLGAELVRAGKAAEGEKVLREGLRRSPRNGFMLFGLMESLKAQGKDFAEVQREFKAVWSKSDLPLSLAML
jgi:tetratricopeptide (TPR) repeat protein